VTLRRKSVRKVCINQAFSSIKNPIILVFSLSILFCLKIMIFGVLFLKKYYIDWTSSQLNVITPGTYYYISEKHWVTFLQYYFFVYGREFIFRLALHPFFIKFYWHRFLSRFACTILLLVLPFLANSGLACRYLPFIYKVR